MLKQLFQDQRQNLNFFFDHIDLSAAEKLLDLFYHCKGTLYFSGIGKSGLVGKKIATTMASINVKASYLSPQDALHGDIGILTKEDIFIFISKSGESEELIHLIPFLRNKGVTLVSWVCEKGSHLARATDIEIVLPLTKELCPFGLMPTTSSAIQMIFGDILATALMRKKGVNLDDFKLNHPAGRIGRRMILKVKDLMVTEESLPLCYPTESLAEKLVTMSSKRCGCLIVVDKQGHLLGIFTDGDLRRALEKFGQDAFKKPFSEIMTSGGRFIESHVLAYDAMVKMEEDPKRPITVLPVLENGAVVGLIKMHDILQSGI